MKKVIASSNYTDALDKLDKEHEIVIDNRIKAKADDAYIAIKNLLDRIYEASIVK